MTIDHWMMFGTFAQQRYFVYPSKDVYRGVIINANMAAHAPAGLGAFLLEKTADNRYIVDPLTHAFQHDPVYLSDKDGRPKSSIRALAEAYGTPVEEIVGERQLLPSDLEDSSVLRGFAERCLDFQREVLRDAMKQNDSMKYLDAADTSLEPYALVAPYFYLTETTVDDWMPLLSGACRHSRELVGANPLFASIVVSRGLLTNKERMKEILPRLKELDVQGYLLWVDDLDEQAASSVELKSLLELARELRTQGTREVINLHGGYFSVLAAGMLGGGNRLSGVAHAPEFGEFRSVVPVGGGIPIARYYIPKLHSRIRYRDAQRYIQKKGWLEDCAAFHKNVCDCSACQDTLSGDISKFVLFGESNQREVKRRGGLVRMEFPTGDTKQRCLRHYLERKNVEYGFSASADPSQIIGDLNEGYEQYREVCGLDGVSHLRLWRDVLCEAHKSGQT